MRVLRPADYRTVPWKNGGGETTEILVWPEGAGQPDFDLRISMAKVAADGPFSVFPGVDRTLSVLSQGALELTLAGRPPLLLNRQSPPFTFPGGVPTSGRPLGGLITDLNVMVRRGKYVARVRRVVAGEALEVGAGAEQLVVFCAEGRVRVEGVELVALEAWCRGGGGENPAIKSVGDSVAYLIEIKRDEANT